MPKPKSLSEEYDAAKVRIGGDPNRDKLAIPDVPVITEHQKQEILKEAAEWSKKFNVMQGEFSPTVPRWPDPVPPVNTSTNPKSRDSSHKIPLSLCPASVRIAIARVFKLGGEKPGRYHWNWREEPISVTQYIDAIHRHLARFEDGEEFDEEMSEQAGQPVAHLDIIASNTAMLIDAREAGTLVNDLPKVKGGAPAFLKRIMGKK